MDDADDLYPAARNEVEHDIGSKRPDGEGAQPGKDVIQAPRTDSRLARSAHDPSKSLVQAERHVAQLCLHTDRWDDRDLYHRWILFDDLWAGAHAELAEAILQFATRWDVLS